MLMLDTEAVSILFDDRDLLRPLLERRLARSGEPPYATTIVSFQEQAKGWFAKINAAKTARQILDAYKSLQGMEKDYRKLRVLPYDSAAQAHFEQFCRQKLRTSTMDLRIACVALAHSATLLTRNLRDFRPIPGLAAEDWAA